MRKSITIKNNNVEIGEEKIKLDNIIIHIDKVGSMRADYLLQIVYDFYKIPNWFSIHRKLNPISKDTKQISEKMKI